MDLFTVQMDAFLDRYCRNYLFSGIVRVTSRGQKVYERCMGYADREKDLPITPQTRFCFYSLSKPFCAIGLLMLAEKGLVDLEAHPARYVPEAQGFDERITLRSMLHHASGMPDFNQLDDPLFDKRVEFQKNPRSLITRMHTVPDNFAPYAGTRYSNIHFMLFALIIENLTGMAYADYIRQEVLAPLGMETAEAISAEMEPADLACGYAMDNGRLIWVDRSRSGLLGAGDLIGTVDDVYCLNEAIKQQKLLKPETWAQVLTPSPISAFGYGCSVTQWHGKKRITHNGGHAGYRTLHIQLPQEDFDIILLSNCGFGNSRATIAEAIHTFWFGDDTPAGVQNEMDAGYIRSASSSADIMLLKPARCVLSAAEEQALLGQYGEICLKKEGDEYIIVLANGLHLPCYPVHARLLSSTCIDEQYAITESADGTLQLMGRSKNVR